MKLCVWSGVIFGLLLTLTGVEPVRAQSSVTAPLNNATSLPVGSCTSTVPCSNGACCNGNSGFCGFGPDYCTPVSSGGNCTSSCDAQAECGQYAPPANLTCPLNVCCSQYGFCGTTAEFCGTGCQSNCGSPFVPSCGAETNSALNRRIGYYNGAAAYRNCMAFPPEQIYTPDLTHVNFAFASISDTFQLVEATPGDSQLWQRTTNLKSQNPTLKVFLSVGGWTFNDPPTSTIFSQLVASSANTNTFIGSLLTVMETYAFDGLDIDWEYPGAYDRGGGPADTENYVTFMAAVKAAFSSAGYGLSFTAPSSYWYLQHFDLPGLLKSADWVNVMTYDLHGVWDGTDPYIGYVLDAHTNLTEIDQAFDLYWRAGVNPSQVVMGFAFYGRSFTLASTGCWDPGCAWVSGGNPGQCSATAGILMFSEIENVLNGTDAQSVTDPVAAVNYMIWDTNQWISYDNAETFGMKISYANDRCIGGSVIWSLDQDDSNYDALTGLYGNVTQGIASGVSQSTGCLVTDPNVQSCPTGYSFVGTIEATDTEVFTRLICCESGNAPSPESCSWGTDVVGNACVPECPPGNILLATSPAFCLSGAMPFCCATNVTATDNCVFGDCSSSPTCPADNPALFVTTAITGGASPPSTCPGGESKAFCCESDFPYQNCSWTGTTPLCLDSGCAIGQVQLLSDPQGDGSQPCSGTGTRSYCCDPIGSAYVPVPFNDVFPSGVTEGAETFDVEFDPDVTTSPQANAASLSNATDNEETEAFGEVFIDSPNPQSVSSLAEVSDWVVTSCNAKSDQPQTVLAYCSKSMDGSGCAHVFIGGTEHTIVQLPRSCGLGPYARVASLVPHANQSVLSVFHQAKKPTSELVYSFSFDYDFSVIPESNGPIYMRADVTDMPGYWDSVVDSPPERKRWLQEQESKKPIVRRWWGAFTTWLSKLTTVEQSGAIARVFSWSDTWTIYRNSVSCPGSPTQPSLEASLDVSLYGFASASARFGFYLQATIVPPSVQAAYLFLNTDASAFAAFTIQGVALVQYDSSNIQFASFGFPGLYYPGLITIGPSLVINGYLSGEISIDATLELVTQLQFPSINIQLGNVGDNFTATPTDVVGSTWRSSTPTTQFGVNVELAGDVSLHLVPALQLGINILNGALVDAQAYVQTDLYAGVSLNGSASLGQTPEVCYSAYVGVDFSGGLTGNLLYWEGASASWPLYQNEIPLAQQCMTLGSGTSKRDVSDGTLPMLLDTPIRSPPGVESSAYILERNGDKERYIYPVNQHSTIDPSERIAKRDSSTAVPTVPGTLLCPGNQGVNETGMDGDVYSDLPTNLLDAVERRSIDVVDEPDYENGDDTVDDALWDLIFDDDDEGHGIERRATIQPQELARKVNIPNCANLQFTALAYDKAATNDYWDVENIDTLDPYYATGSKSPYATSRTYNQEHIYEIQLVAQFIAQIYSLTVWQTPGQPNNLNTFCNWVNTNILQSPIQNQLATCLPNNQLGVTNGPYMPSLEAWANSIKARAFIPQNIFTQSTFDGYTDSKKVAVMRATSGLMTYMNDPKVKASFISSSDCIRDVWGGADNTGTIVPLYNAWVVGKLNTFNTQIQSGINNMLQWWNAAAGSTTTLVPVVVGYSDFVTRNPTAFNYDASGQELQTEIVNFATGNLINWINNF